MTLRKGREGKSKHSAKEGKERKGKERKEFGEPQVSRMEALRTALLQGRQSFCFHRWQSCRGSLLRQIWRKRRAKKVAETLRIGKTLSFGLATNPPGKITQSNWSTTSALSGWMAPRGGRVRSLDRRRARRASCTSGYSGCLF